MLYNDLTPDIDVNPETYEVKVNGKLATVDPVDKVSLARLYNLF
jgi:urease subunit alpha